MADNQYGYNQYTSIPSKQERKLTHLIHLTMFWFNIHMSNAMK